MAYVQACCLAVFIMHQHNMCSADKCNFVHAIPSLPALLTSPIPFPVDLDLLMSGKIRKLATRQEIRFSSLTDGNSEHEVEHCREIALLARF